MRVIHKILKVPSFSHSPRMSGYVGIFFIAYIIIRLKQFYEHGLNSTITLGFEVLICRFNPFSITHVSYYSSFCYCEAVVYWYISTLVCRPRDYGIRNHRQVRKNRQSSLAKRRIWQLFILGVYNLDSQSTLISLADIALRSARSKDRGS